MKNFKIILVLLTVMISLTAAFANKPKKHVKGQSGYYLFYNLYGFKTGDPTEYIYDPDNEIGSCVYAGANYQCSAYWLCPSDPTVGDNPPSGSVFGSYPSFGNNQEYYFNN